MKRVFSLLLTAALIGSLAFAAGCAARIEPVSSRTVEDDLAGEPGDSGNERPAGPEAPQEAGETFGAPPSKTHDGEGDASDPKAPSVDEAPSEPEQPSGPSQADGEASQPQDGVTAEMYTEQGQYPLGTESVRVFILNKGSAELGYDAYYSLEQQQGESWQEVPAELSFEDWAGILPAGKETSLVTDLAPFAGQLQAGRYRIVKKLDGQVFYAPFELV